MHVPAPGGMPDPFVLSTAEFGALANANSQTAASGIHPVANSAYFYPVYLTQRRTYTMAFWVNGATVAGAVDVGVYKPDGVKVASTGAITQAVVTSIQIVDIADFTLDPGYYLLALSESLATATFWRGAPDSPQMRAAGAYQMATAHPLPATATFASIAGASCPLFGFSERTTV